LLNHYIIFVFIHLEQYLELLNFQFNMPFDPNSAKKAGKKSKRGPAKKEGPSVKEKMELLYEKVLDDLLVNQEKLTKTERVKVFVTLSNYIFPKTKSVRDKFTLEQLKEKREDHFNQDPDPTK
jgi:hypothetical protein